MEGGWIGDGDDDGDDLPSPEAKSSSRLALPRENRGWRRLHDRNWKSDCCFGFFPVTRINRGVDRAPEEGEAPRRPVGAARCLEPLWPPSGPTFGPWKLQVRGFFLDFQGIF